MNEHHRSEHHLARAMSRLTVGLTDAQRRRSAADDLQAGYDMAQNVQLEVQGLASREVAYTEEPVTFPYPFVMRVARTQTDGALSKPHFTSGVEIYTDQHITLDAQVRRWIMDDSQFITGALVRVAVWAPDALKLTRYSATLHLTFSGYAAPADNDDDDEG